MEAMPRDENNLQGEVTSDQRPAEVQRALKLDIQERAFWSEVSLWKNPELRKGKEYLEQFLMHRYAYQQCGEIKRTSIQRVLFHIKMFQFNFKALQTH